MRSSLRFPLGVILSTLTLLVATSVPAHAAGPNDNYTFTKSFSVTKERYYSTLARCIKVTLEGSITTTVKYENRWSAFYRSRKINHPTLRVATFTQCGPGPWAYKNSYKVEMTHWWNSSTCSANVGISASAPWGVSVGATPSCSNARRAKRATTYTGWAGLRNQYNSDTVVKFSDEYLQPLAWGHAYGGTSEVRSPLCFKGSADVVVYSDTSNSDSYHPTFTPCVTWW